MFIFIVHFTVSSHWWWWPLCFVRQRRKWIGVEYKVQPNIIDGIFFFPIFVYSSQMSVWYVLTVLKDTKLSHSIVQYVDFSPSSHFHPFQNSTDSVTHARRTHTQNVSRLSIVVGRRKWRQEVSSCWNTRIRQALVQIMHFPFQNTIFLN